MRIYVRRRKTYPPPESVPFYHRPVYAHRPAQHTLRLVQLPCQDEFSYQRAADRPASATHPWEHAHPETQFSAEGSQQTDSAGRASAETKIIAHVNMARVQSRIYDILEELFRRKRGEGRREIQHDADVYAAFGDKLYPVRQRIKTFLALRMGIKSQGHRCPAGRPGHVPQRRDHHRRR